MSPDQPISFARGAPSLDIIDVEGLGEAAQRAFAENPGPTTAYGTSVGFPPLRSWIAERHGVEAACVLVTNGSMQADAFLFEHLVAAGDTVIVERPTYDRTLLSLRGRGADVRMVELEPDGIDVDALSALLADGLRPRLAHIIPNFQNPAGYTLSRAKRDALLALAQEHGFTIFEDDPYVALRFSGESLPTMLSLDQSESVVYASSFSKTVCPGIRVGYLVGTAGVIGDIAKLATETYISPNMVAQSIVYQFCGSGAIERSIETVRSALAERVQTLSRALERELPRCGVRRPRRRLFHVGHAPGGNRRQRPLHGRRRARRELRARLRLPAGGRREHAAPGLLGRHPRADRRGRGPPGRRPGLSLAAVALAAQHQLLGQRDASRRRRIGDHRDGLGDAGGHDAAAAVGLDDDLLVVALDQAAPPGPARAPTP